MTASGSQDLTLVTGGTGFVGSAVVRALIARGDRVRVLVRPTSRRDNLDGLPVEFARGSLEDPASLAAAAADCRYLYHVAADYRLWVRDADAMLRANIDGTSALMAAAAAAGVTKIVYTSSVATLGLAPGGVPADETTPVTEAQMIGPYKRSKYLAERVVDEWVRRGLAVVIVNPSTPIGPCDIKPTPTGRIVVEMLNRRMPAYVETGLNFAHVDDVAAGHLLAMAHGRVGERYILGGENWMLAQFLGEIGRASGAKPPRIRLPLRPLIPVAMVAEALARLTGGEPFVTRDGLRLAAKLMFFSSAKAARELHYRPRPARHGVEDAVAWFTRHGYVRSR